MTAVVIAMTLLFAMTNGFHDSANSIAALVATRAARPGPAVLLAAAGHVAGPLLLGTAVANTVAGVVTPPESQLLPVLASAVLTAIVWNALTWWRGLPSSSSHSLVGGLVGACAADAGWGAVHWGGVGPAGVSGVLGVLLGLAVSPLLGAAAGLLLIRLAGRGLRKARRQIEVPIKRAQWLTSGALALSHGANDAQKSMGIVALVLVADGSLRGFSVPLWVKLACAFALTAGTALGGWRIVRTIGRGIYPMRPLEGLVSQGGSAAVILAAAAAGAPVSTTHVVAASVVGVGLGQHRRHVRWSVVEQMALAWVVTLPVSGVLAALMLPAWKELS